MADINAKQNIGVSAGPSFAEAQQGFSTSHEPVPADIAVISDNNIKENLLIPPSFKPLPQPLQPNAPAPKAVSTSTAITQSEIKPIFKRKTQANLISILIAPFKRLWNGHSITPAIDFISDDIKVFLDRCSAKDKAKDVVSLSTDIEPVKSMGEAVQIQTLISGLNDIKLVNAEGEIVLNEDIDKNFSDGSLFFTEGTERKIPLKTNEDLRLLYLLYAEKDKINVISPSKTEIETIDLFQSMSQSGINFADTTGNSLSTFEVFEDLGKEAIQIKSPSFRTEKFEDIADLTVFAYISGKKDIDINVLPENTRYLLKSLTILNTKGINFCNKEKEPISPFGVYRHFKEFEKEGEFKGDIYCDYKDGAYSRIDKVGDLGLLAQNILSPSKEEILKKLEGKYFKDKAVLNKITEIISEKSADINCEFSEDDLIDCWEKLIKMYPQLIEPIKTEDYEKGIKKIFEILVESPLITKNEDLNLVLENIYLTMKKSNNITVFFNNFPAFIKKINGVGELQEGIKDMKWHPIYQIAITALKKDLDDDDEGWACMKEVFETIIHNPDISAKCKESADYGLSMIKNDYRRYATEHFETNIKEIIDEIKI